MMESFFWSGRKGEGTEYKVDGRYLLEDNMSKHNKEHKMQGLQQLSWATAFA